MVAHAFEASHKAVKQACGRAGLKSPHQEFCRDSHKEIRPLNFPRQLQDVRISSLQVVEETCVSCVAFFDTRADGKGGIGFVQSERSLSEP